MTVAVVTWPVAAIWIALIVATTTFAIAALRFGFRVEFRDPDLPDQPTWTHTTHRPDNGGDK